MNDFDQWNIVKQEIHCRKDAPLFLEKDVFFIRVGKNIGCESCGKGDEFSRPVLVLKKFSRETFLGIPLSKTKKRGSYYKEIHEGILQGSIALLHQIRVFDAKRFSNKLTRISDKDFMEISLSLCNLLFNKKLAPANAEAIPKEKVPPLYSSIPHKTTKSIILLAHNIRSLWNVGSLFRTSDAFNVEKVYLTGYTGTPPRREIHKTALGAEQWIEWEYEQDPSSVIQTLKKDGYTITGLELHPTATNITEYVVPKQCCLLLGNEVLGISDELLTLCDDTVYIPMNGKKESLNVSVATGIALHQLTLNSAS